MTQKNITVTLSPEEFKDNFGFDESSGLYNDPKFRLVMNKFGRCYWLLSIDNLQGPRFSGVNVYYQGMQYMSNEQLVAMNLQDLISGYGGTLGFFLGIIY
jgi:hypothetical protein